jgi:hypothetical protein
MVGSGGGADGDEAVGVYFAAVSVELGLAGFEGEAVSVFDERHVSMVNPAKHVVDRLNWTHVREELAGGGVAPEESVADGADEPELRVLMEEVLPGVKELATYPRMRNSRVSV